MKHPSEFVYHFTSAGAALSIVTKRQLWATDIEYLNDRNEGQLPKKILKSIIEHPNIHLPGLQTTQKHLGALKQSLNHGLVACTISFSQHFRSLPQFRMYCPPAGGYAIGFPLDYLSKIGTLIQCDYSHSHLVEWCRAYAREFLADAASSDREDLDAENLCYEMLGRKPYIQARVLASLRFKSEEFVNELEFRLVAFGLPRQFRESPDRNLIIPYSAVDLPNDEIELRVAPGPNREPILANGSIASMTTAARDAGTKWNIAYLSPGEFGFRA